MNLYGRMRIISWRLINSKLGIFAISRTPERIRLAAKALIFGQVAIANIRSPRINSQEIWAQDHFSKFEGLQIAKGNEKKPLLAVLLPVFKIDVETFKKLLDSLVAQNFTNFEVCVAAHGAPSDINNLLIESQSSGLLNLKVDFSDSNLGISQTSNKALSLVNADYIVLLDHDDELPAFALNEVAKSILDNPKSNLFYTDKRTVDHNGETIDILLKPNWSPEMLLSANYVTHLNAIKTSVVREIGGWDPATDGAQDWDLFLRLALLSDQITHIPAIAYTWRQVETSVSMNGAKAKPYIVQGQKNAIQKYLDARFPGSSVVKTGAGETEIRWANLPYVSLAGPAGFEKFKSETQYLSLPKETVVILGSSSEFQVMSGNMEDITGLLQNNEIAAVTGIFVNQSGEIIDGARVQLATGESRPLFWRRPLAHNSVIGSTSWIRNCSSISPILFAARIGDVRVLLEKCDSIEDLVRHLGAKGRLVSNPKLVIYPPENQLEIPPVNEIKDPYFSGDLAMTLNGPILSSRDIQRTDSKDTYTEQAEYFIQNLPKVEALASNTNSKKIEHLAWLLPGFSSAGYGGIRTILRFANYMQDRGIQSSFYINGKALPESLLDEIRRDFPALTKSKFRSYVQGQKLNLAKYDCAIATLWTTAYDLAADTSAIKKIYLVQDFEPDFYPSGTLKLQAQHSYMLGLKHITNTKSLSGVLHANGIASESFEPGLDFNVFNSSNRTGYSSNTVSIFFYMRPGHPRNCFELNLEIIKKLKKLHGDSVQIICAGSEFKPETYGLGDLVDYVGMLPYAETGELYRKMDIGVSLMASSHPSYPPLEMMACGVAVVTNYNPATVNYFNSENSVVVPPILNSIVDQITFLVENKEARATLSLSAAQYARKHFAEWDNVSLKFLDLVRSV